MKPGGDSWEKFSDTLPVPESHTDGYADYICRPVQPCGWRYTVLTYFSKHRRSSAAERAGRRFTGNSTYHLYRYRYGANGRTAVVFSPVLMAGGMRQELSASLILRRSRRQQRFLCALICAFPFPSGQIIYAERRLWFLRIQRV